jgi:hypothetical protein
MYNEIVNNKILNEFGEDISLDYDTDFSFDSLWIEINEQIEKLYNKDFEILEDLAGQLYFNFINL